MRDVSVPVTQRIADVLLCQLIRKNVCRDVAKAPLVRIEIELAYHIARPVSFDKRGHAWRLIAGHAHLYGAGCGKANFYGLVVDGRDRKDLVVMAIIGRDRCQTVMGCILVPLLNDRCEVVLLSRDYL